MPLVPGLSPSIRQDGITDDAAIQPQDFIVEVTDDNTDIPEFDDSGNILKIEHVRPKDYRSSQYRRLYRVLTAMLD